MTKTCLNIEKIVTLSISRRQKLLNLSLDIWLLARKDNYRD